jgi:hypothetical protein
MEIEDEPRYEEAMKAYEKGVDLALNETSHFILKRARDYIEFKDVYDTGKMSQTANVDISKEFEKYVFFVEKYAPFMEMGTGPAAEEPQPRYVPPLKPLIDWCRRKGIRFEKKKGGRMSFEETANAIRWHIYHYGIQPRPFFRPAAIDGTHEQEKYYRKFVNKSMREEGFRARTRVK